MSGLLIGCVVLTGIAGLFLAPWLARRLGVAMNLPMVKQPHGLQWTLLFLAFMMLSLCACYLLGSVLFAVVLQQGFGWSGARVRRLMFHSEFPPHWLKTTGPE